MASNQLLDRRGEKRGPCGVEKIEEMVVSLNAEHWVQRMGRHYFVKREANPNFKFGSSDPKERQFIHSLAWTG
jgi:hypothetical protein